MLEVYHRLKLILTCKHCIEIMSPVLLASYLVLELSLGCPMGRSTV